jgi:hypothetical protein
LHFSAGCDIIEKMYCKTINKGEPK